MPCAVFTLVLCGEIQTNIHSWVMCTRSRFEIALVTGQSRVPRRALLARAGCAHGPVIRQRSLLGMSFNTNGNTCMTGIINTVRVPQEFMIPDHVNT